jgi:predicted nucleotidyltransferase
MATIRLPTEFGELLKLLNAHEVKYLIVGGYAVAYHGYPRTTGDIDIWIDRSGENARRTVEALREFGFDVPTLQPELLMKPDRIVRMGYPPLRVEILTSASGVEFAPCYENRVEDEMGGTTVSIIGLECLKKNKRASGRHKDLDDLEHLP